MQMFGVGIMELTLILLIGALVVGPERLPEVAAELARWIRRARAYGTHLTKDFSDVVGELEKEVGTSREDWKEIASVMQHHTSGMAKEFENVTTQLERAGGEAGNVVPFEQPRIAEPAASAAEPASDATQATPLAELTPEPGTPAETEPETAPAEEKPWYESERAPRRRRQRS
jgi:sec-independent protein translocase protein TatB